MFSFNIRLHVFNNTSTFVMAFKACSEIAFTACDIEPFDKLYTTIHKTVYNLNQFVVNNPFIVRNALSIFKKIYFYFCKLIVNPHFVKQAYKLPKFA